MSTADMGTGPTSVSFHSHMTLEAISPEDAVEQYLSSREQELAATTLRDHRYRLTRFLEWAEEFGLHDMTDLTGRRCERFKNWRIRSCDINSVTLENHLRTFRVFVRYCESIDAVEPGTADKIIIPRISKGEAVDEDTIEHERAEQVIDYLCRFDWATDRHIVFHTLWHTGCRRGALHGLDLDDWHPSESYLTFRHRPETDTPLKLKYDGERNVTIADDRLVSAIEDYVQHNRQDVTDEHNRDPLLTSRHGRLSANAIQSKVYDVTRPCVATNECPHDRDIESCEAREYGQYSTCPSSVSPHPVRRSSITAHLNSDVPKEIASERMSVSVDTLEQHYDARTNEDKRKNRRQYLNNI